MTKRIIRPLRFEGGIAFVPLTRGLEAIIDACDAELVSRHNWHASKHGNTYYAKTNLKKGSVASMHRMIIPCDDDQVIDHIDGDGTNNRRSNIRAVKQWQNMCNSGIRPHNTSGFKGVYFDRVHQKWKARITVNSRRLSLGSYATAQEASDAYQKASAEYHGEFARD